MDLPKDTYLFGSFTISVGLLLSVLYTPSGRKHGAHSNNAKVLSWFFVQMPYSDIILVLCMSSVKSIGGNC